MFAQREKRKVDKTDISILIGLTAITIAVVLAVAGIIVAVVLAAH